MRRYLLLLVLAGCPKAEQPALPAASTSAPVMTPSPGATALVTRLVDAKGHFFVLEKDPAVAAVMALGDQAVPALIDALEKDERPTHVEFDREREYEKVSYSPVYRIAWWLLERMFATSYFKTSDAQYAINRSPAERARVAAELRAEWRKVGAVTREERWYRTLADDNAQPAAWNDVAAKIFEWVEDLHFYDPSDVTKGAKMQGEVLRGHAAPTVSELVVRRIAAVELGDACELARLLARWDRTAAESVLVQQMRRAIAASGDGFEEGHCIWSLATVRAKLGDASAIDEYAAWIARTKPPHDLWDPSSFQPMGQNASRPSIVAAGERLFAAGSPWLPLIGSRERAGLLGQHLYGVPAFKRHVIASLADKSSVGVVEISASGAWSLEMTDLGFSTSTPAGTDGFPTSPGKVTVRLRDYYAYQVAHQYKAPAFELYWPEARRDAAIVAIVAWVTAQ